VSVPLKTKGLLDPSGKLQTMLLFSYLFPRGLIEPSDFEGTDTQISGIDSLAPTAFGRWRFKQKGDHRLCPLLRLLLGELSQLT